MKFYRDYKCDYELEYNDVFIVPQYSEIISRKNVDISVEIIPGKLKLDIPVFSANMSSITEEDMCISMYNSGGMGVMHRFISIEDNIKKYNIVKQNNCECFVSLGVNEESKERAKKLYESGARYFCIDIAHGNSVLMKNMIHWLKINFNDIILMAGNIATPDGIENLYNWGADICKLNIAPGAVCITKNQTGCMFPVISCLIDCSKKAKELNIPVIADGGLVEYGDICKAIAIGCDAVMSGKFFAGCQETPEQVDENGNKPYFGMASKRAMSLIKREEDMATPEGKEIVVKSTNTSAASILKDIKGALQSSMSYSNSKNIKEFQDKVIFGIKKQRV